MTLDSTNSHSTADETKRFHDAENKEFPKGKHVPVPDAKAGAAIEAYSDTNTTDRDKAAEKDDECTSWSYLFVHNQKMKLLESWLLKDNITYFVHRSIRYMPRRGKGGVHQVSVPTVSGLVFLQGSPKVLQAYLYDRFPGRRLCKNCSTGMAAVIPDRQMRPFMRVAETAPDRIRFLLRPFHYYAKNHTLLRIMSGDLAGLEGYVVRIDRDRRLVMDVGGISVAVSGIHAERFEEVGKNEATKHERAMFGKRNLHERNAFIDRYFHQLKTEQDVAAQVENIDMLRMDTMADLKAARTAPADAYATLHFVVEEIGYYYAPVADMFKGNLHPIFEAGGKVMDKLCEIISQFAPNDDCRQQWEQEYEELRANYGYLFE